MPLGEGASRSSRSHTVVHDVEIGALVAAADIVGLADRAALQDERERVGVILDVEPVANVQAIAIDGQRLAREALG